MRRNFLPDCHKKIVLSDNYVFLNCMTQTQLSNYDLTQPYAVYFIYIILMPCSSV